VADRAARPGAGDGPTLSKREQTMRIAATGSTTTMMVRVCSPAPSCWRMVAPRIRSRAYDDSLLGSRGVVRQGELDEVHQETVVGKSPASSYEVNNVRPRGK